MPHEYHCWFTAAWDEASSLQASVLAQSLRNVVTRGKIVVMVVQPIPECIKALLAEAFDQLFYIDCWGILSSNGFPPVDIAKICAWECSLFKKCVFLHPDTMVLKNMDELFEETSIFCAGSTESSVFETTIFTFQPSYHVYQQLFKLSVNGQQKNASEIFQIYFGQITTPTNSCLVDIYQRIAGKIVSSSKSLCMTNVRERIRQHQGISLPEEAVVLCNDRESIALLQNDILTTEILSNQNQIMEKEVHNYLQDSIAVIGYSCRFPSANNRREFWELLKMGGDGISQMPIERLTERQMEDPRYTSIQAGFLKCPIDEFDAKFFGISPREAVYMDPQQRLLLEVAWEALENSGINPHKLKGSNTGVFTGVWTREYETLLTKVESTGANFHHIVLGNTHGATSARISYFLGLNGPNIATESGCSSSMVSVHLACQSLRRHETNLNLVGGVNLLCAQFPHGEVSILAKDGHCKTFDEKADGFARGEGCGVLVMKRYADAIKDGDRITAIIRGTGISNEGTTTSFGTPSKHCQSISIKEAIKNSGINPLSLDYVEAHGTGTPIGDPIEFSAIANAYAGEREHPLLVGSVKTNIGHSESAAGIAGVIKVMMAMENELIPAHINLEILNPNINLESIPAEIPTTPRKWLREAGKARLAGVSSFGISGTNVHVILQEPPIVDYSNNQTSKTETEREHEILTLSAKGDVALKDLVQKYIRYFEENPMINLKDIAFTANNCRGHFKQNRLAVVGSSISEIKLNLEQESFVTSAAVSSKPVLTFLFTGQGSQYVGMAKTLYETCTVFKEAIDNCSELLQNNCPNTLQDILWNADQALIDQTMYSQISIFCVEYGLLKLWESMGVRPDYVLGHSVGEFAAATAAEVITLKEAITLVSERSRLIHKLPPGGMLAVRTSVENVKDLISKFLLVNSNCWLDIAVINSSEEVVVAGKAKVLENFAEFCKDSKIRVQILAATHAFHSRDMESIIDEFGVIANTIDYKSPKCIYISGSTGKLCGQESFSSKYWQRHARDCVDFASSIKSLETNGCNVFVEIGVHPILLALTMNNLTTKSDQNYLWLPSIRKTENEWATLLTSLGKMYVNGFDLDWTKINSSLGRKKMELPTYPFQRSKFWVEIPEQSEETVSCGKLLHPLLGSKIVSASPNQFLFQCDLDLQKLPYLQDHQVANIVVLPGAAFLEIILAAGMNVFKNSGKSEKLFLQDFLIEAPLELETGKKAIIQTVATFLSTESNDILEIKVYLYCKLNGYNEDKGWRCYASAKVSNRNVVAVSANGSNSSEPPSGQNLDTDLDFSGDNSVDVNSVKSRCELETQTKEFYDKVPELGILFGKTFQSIQKVWKGTNEALALIPIPENARNMNDYIYHPIVLDAMIQAFALTVGQEKKELHLPIGIDKVHTVKLNCSGSMFAHVSWEEGQSNGSVILYDETGNVLASMQGVRLVRTSIHSFLKVINAHKNQLPAMYQDVWRARDGPAQSRIDFSTLKSVEEISESARNEVTWGALDIEDNGRQAGNKLLYDHLLEVFLQMGWTSQNGAKFTVKELMTDLLISPVHEMFIERILEIFSEEELLENNFDTDLNCSVWELKKDILTACVTTAQRDQYKKFVEQMVDGSEIVRIYQAVRNVLQDILQGKRSAVSALFSEDLGVDILRIYGIGLANKRPNSLVSAFITTAFENSISSGSVIRFLEIGAGSGTTTEYVLSALTKTGIPFRYTFTDISPHFMEGAQKKFTDYTNVDYKVLNIENDPKEQGFTPFHYDVVIATSVMHTTINIKEAVQNVRHLLVPSGYFAMIEMFRPIRYADFMFGAMDGYWRFKDFDLRPSHPTLSLQKWEKLFSECGFSISVCPHPELDLSAVFVQASDEFNSCDRLSIRKGDSGTDREYCTVIFDDGSIVSKILQERLMSVGANIVTIRNVNDNSGNSSGNFYVDPRKPEETTEALGKIGEQYNFHSVIYLWTNMDEQDQECMCSVFLTLLKFLYAVSGAPKCILVTRGTNYIGDQGKVNPSAATLVGMMHTYRNERFDDQSMVIDLDPDNFDGITESREIFSEMWNSSGEKITAFRKCKKFVIRGVDLVKPPVPLRIPKFQRYTLIVPNTKKINDVTYRPTEKTEIKSNEVEIAVKAIALNFRDIFVILKPEMYFTKFESVGSDFAGVVTEVGSEVTQFQMGDEVFGASNVTSVASHIVVVQDIVMLKPQHYTFADACTLPSVFMTAFLCLVEVGKLKKGETILIHVASGGVGLIAIQLAKMIGAKIIATAGNRRKRAYLRSVGIEHVFHSRDTSYGEQIEKVTDGKGVDVVLNSLTGPNFKETTLSACSLNARFVEIGKVNIWKPEEVAALRPDVIYTVADLEGFDIERMKTLVGKVGELLKRRNIEPLPYTRFEGVQIKEALNYFVKAQHIGKIVVAMPEYVPAYSKQICNISLFNINSTYLITGGLGGIGLEVAKWMTTCGAQNLVLVARTKPDASVCRTLDQLKAKGIRVLTFQCDVGDWNQCQNLFSNLNDPKINLPPLRGVIHSAGYLSDSIINNQSWEKFSLVFNAKVNGGWNLHRLTKDTRLEHFILFSSAAGGFGAPGQMNHSAANCFLDSLGSYRYSLGLPVQVIDWGAWSEIGAATNTAYGNEGKFGVTPFCPSQGLSSLNYIITRPFLQVTVAQVQLGIVKELLVSQTKYLEEIVDEGTVSSPTQTVAEVDAFWKDITDLDLDKRIFYIRKHIEKLIRQTLKLPNSEIVDEHQSFSEMGLDSLMAVEMKNKLQQIFGKYIAIKTTSLMEHPTLAGLSKYLAELTMTVDITATADPNTDLVDNSLLLSAEELHCLIQEDSLLPDHIKGVGNCTNSSKIEKLFITGATGHLGVYMLSEISKKTNIKIYCLIRGKTVDGAKKRLESSLTKFDLLSSVHLSNINIVLGNVALENLGISDEEYKHLSEEIDAVLHLAVKANHVEPYIKHEGTTDDIRSINALGTLHALEFASNVKTKRFIYPGSFSSANEFTEEGYLLEELPSVENFGEGVNFGYGISKLVSEKLIGQAISRGIPCIVLRYSSLIGHSETGLFTLDTNFIMSSAVTFGQMGMIPKLKGAFNAIPIDIAAKLSCQLIFNDSVESGLYNINHPNQVTVETYLETAHLLGLSVKVVETSEFEAKIRSDQRFAASIFSNYVTEGQGIVDTVFNGFPVSRRSLEYGSEVYKSHPKIEKYMSNSNNLMPPLDVVMRRHVMYAKVKGMLESFKIKTNL